MNIHMKIFRSQHFDPLRVVMLDDEPWYIVTDICRTLGYGNATKAVRLVRQEDKTIIHVPNLSVGSNPANAVNLSGLETLIVRSRKREEAAAFSRWLADTVFPIVYEDDPKPEPVGLSPAFEGDGTALRDAAGCERAGRIDPRQRHGACRAGIFSVLQGNRR